MTRGDIKRVLNMFQKKLVRIPGPRGPATISICKCPITLQIVEMKILGHEYDGHCFRNELVTRAPENGVDDIEADWSAPTPTMPHLPRSRK